MMKRINRYIAFSILFPFTAMGIFFCEPQSMVKERDRCSLYVVNILVSMDSIFLYIVNLKVHSTIRSL